MIKKITPITMTEIESLVGESESGDNIKKFLYKFKNKKDMDIKKIFEMKKELSDLDFIKLKDGDIVKIVDFMPEDGSDIAKIVHGTSFDKDEVNKILEIVKKY